MFPRFLLATALLALSFQPIHAQSPEDRYMSAKSAFAAHSDGFLTDGSPEAVVAIKQLWAAIADLVIQRRTVDPKISAIAIDHDLCLLTFEPNPPEAVQVTAEDECRAIDSHRNTVLDLGHDLFLIAPFTGEIGTVFLVGPKGGKLAVLWSIDETAAPSNDPHDLIGAWKPDRDGRNCRDDKSTHKPGACGPLYAALGLLPPDAEHHPRFYIDAGYSQQIRGTIGKQTTIWVWTGAAAELLWSDWHDAMIDQSRGTDFGNGILSVVSKTDYRSFFACGSCEGRQLEHDVLIEPTRIRDLGTHPLVPEVEVIDTLIYRIAHGQSTARLASPKVAALLRRQLRDSKTESAKIAPGWFSIGMMDDWLVTVTSKSTLVCITPDDVGQLTFTLRRTLNGGYFVASVKQNSGDSECASRTWLPDPK